MIETRRLLCEPVNAAHADEMYPVLRDPRIYAHLSEKPPSSVDALRERYGFLHRRRSPDGTEIWLNWILRLRETGRPIGFYQATVRPENCSIAFVVDPAHWRRGYAAEASDAIITHLFQQYRVAAVTTEISVHNEASIGLVRRLGFSFVRHDAAESDDVYEVSASGWVARTAAPIRVREHGARGPLVVVLHGGPAAVGEAAPIARGLADGFRVLEPWQRGSGKDPLTVARHVADLHEVVVRSGDGAPVAIVGESWGAMLALAYAAAHPESAGPLALVGCGTFDLAARARFRAELDRRMDAATRARLSALERAGASSKERFALIESLYLVDPLPPEVDPEADAVPLDERAHRETWDDMLRCQASGLYPAAFAAIRTPVLMLHGEDDPHPGPMIRDSLRPHVPQLRYVSFPRCGHSPWRERRAREPFFAALRGFLREPTVRA